MNRDEHIRLYEPENPKDRLGVKKPPLHLIPASAEVAEAMAMALGAQRYGPFNWRNAKVKASVYVSAARRHLAQWFDGQDNDPESGASHLAHVRACMGILLDAIETGNLIDDRPPPGAASALIERFIEKSPEHEGYVPAAHAATDVPHAPKASQRDRR